MLLLYKKVSAFRYMNTEVGSSFSYLSRHLGAGTVFLHLLPLDVEGVYGW